MKADCVLEKLKKGVSLVERMVGKNASLPALGSIKIVADKNQITLFATNVSVGIEYTLPARIHTPGTIAIPAQLLASCIQNIPGDQNISIENTINDGIISFSGGTISLRTIPVEDFPTIPRVYAEQKIIMPVYDIVLGIKSVLFAAAQTDIKPELSSVYMYTAEGMAYFVATDAFRLAEKKIKIEETVSFSDVMLPAKNAIEIVRVLGEMNQKENVTIAISENQISFTTEGGCYITSRLIGGTYPNYQMILPKETKTECIALKSDIQVILKTLTALSDRDYRIDMRISPQSHECIFSSKNPDVGEGSYTLTSVLKGDEIEVRVNLKHFWDIINSLSGESVSISFTEPSKPIIIRDVDNKNYLSLMMPISR